MSTDVEEVVLPNEEAAPEEPEEEEPLSEEKLSEKKSFGEEKTSFDQEKKFSSQGQPFGGQKPPSFGEEKPPSFGGEKPPSFGGEKPPSFGGEKPPSFGKEKSSGEVVDPSMKDSKRSSFSNQPPKGPRASFSKDPSPFPLQKPSSKANFRPQPGLRVTNKPSMQRQLGQALQRASRYLPNCRHGDAWMYAAVYVAFYTLLMLFRMSTFGFICIMVYTILFTLLVLRYFGHGPLVSLGSISARSPRR